MNCRPDARFRIDSIPTDERMGALVVADLNGDGRPDLAFYGDAKDLEVIYNNGTNGWSEPKRWHIADGQLNPECAGRRGFERRRARPTWSCSATTAHSISCRNCRTTRWASRRKFPARARPNRCRSWTWTATAGTICCWWIGTARRRCGSGCKTPPASWGRKFISGRRPCARFAWTISKANDKNYIVTIARDSGRAEVSQFTRQPAEILSGAFRRGQFQILPLNKTDAAQRGLLWADVNGDGRPDLLVAEPASGQLSVYLQSPGRFARPAPDLSHPRRRQPARGGGLERRRPAGYFSPEPGRKRRRRDPV